MAVAAGHDKICSGGGRDFVDGGAGDDAIFGGDGDDELSGGYGEDFINGLSTGVMQDIRIWENKIHRAHPVLCKADTYLIEFRKWVRQFYGDAA